LRAASAALFILANSGTRRAPHRSAFGVFVFYLQKEEIIKKEIGVLALRAVLAFDMAASAWAQGGGAGGPAGGVPGTGAAGTAVSEGEVHLVRTHPM
jgi:hypothetical protein